MKYTEARKAIAILMKEWQAAGRDTVTLLAAMDEAVRDVRHTSGVEVEQWAAAMRSEREAGIQTAIIYAARDLVPVLADFREAMLKHGHDIRDVNEAIRRVVMKGEKEQ